MTKRNLPWTFEDRKPFLLKPVGKDYLWGGTRLNDEFSKNIPLSPLAETWECSTHPDGMSVVDSGYYKGITLSKLISERPHILGSRYEAKGELPILIKLIDAKENLSVQVHPDDHYAKEHEHGQSGKSEMWYVLDSEKNSSIVYGFRKDTTKEDLQNAIENGIVERLLNRVLIQKDDIFFVKAGTVHAIGAGALIAEIQENSNLTYRMYDYNRVDKNGEKRQLHLKKAMDVANLSGIDVPRQPMRVLKYRQGMASELLCRCQYFQAERILLNTERTREKATFQTNESTFQTMLCISGCGVIEISETEHICFFKGDCVFIPANSIEVKIHGKAQMLKVVC